MFCLRLKKSTGSITAGLGKACGRSAKEGRLRAFFVPLSVCFLCSLRCPRLRIKWRKVVDGGGRKVWSEFYPPLELREKQF